MKNFQKFINTYKQAVIESCVGTGLLPSVTFAQMSLEASGVATQLGEYGLSSLAYNHNNYFGIKWWDGYTGGVTIATATEVVNGQEIKVTGTRWCKFKDVGDCIKWRVVFLKRNQRYKRALVFEAPDAKTQLQCLIKAGYATDPNYVSKCMAIINQYNLTSLDVGLKKKIIELEKEREFNRVISVNPLQLIFNLFNRADSTKVSQ